MHTFFKECGKKKASCNSGVAIQAGDDVIMIEAGKKKKKAALDVIGYINGDLTEGTRVIKYKGGSKYRVMSYVEIIYLFFDALDIDQYMDCQSKNVTCHESAPTQQTHRLLHIFLNKCNPARILIKSGLKW